ncbi:hypothetical protein [Microbacterium sp. MMO-10]|uniref:hypothetical protein n=1 Tax=Microbacterium sp. MMO-10 TaxID=3081272 RepID=UPI003019C1BD
MKPVVIFDANPLHGLKTLSGADFGSLLALSRLGIIRIIVPDVVVHELARQGAKEFNDKHSKLRNAVKELNDVIGAARSVDVIAHPSATSEGPKPLTRSAVYDAMETFLRGKRVRVSRYASLRTPVDATTSPHRTGAATDRPRVRIRRHMRMVCCVEQDYIAPGRQGSGGHGNATAVSVHAVEGTA